MTTQTITPNATPVAFPTNHVWDGAGGWQAGNTAHTYLADALDASGVQGSDTYTGTLDFTTYILASNEKARALRIKARGYAEDAVFQVRMSSGGTLGGTADFPVSHSPFTLYGSWLNNPPDTGANTEWTQAKIDAVRAQVDASSGSPSPFTFLVKLDIEIDVYTQPTVTISNPTADQTIVDNVLSLTWSYSGGADVQRKYRVKVFTAAVAEGGGFNVDTSATVVDTGDVTSSASSISVSGLDYGVQYYVFVKVAKLLVYNNGDWWSNWSTGRRFSTNSRPVVDVTAPTDPQTITNRPMITWNYSDANGDAQTHYHVKVYERPGASWSGFDPETAASPLWDTGEVSSADTSVQIGAMLANAKNYRTYVKVKQSQPSVIYSLWDYLEFNTNFPIPATPRMTAAVNVSNVDLSITPGPIVLRLDGVSGSYADTPDAADLEVTGDLDARALVNPTSWRAAQAFFGKALGSPANKGWYIGINASGNLQLTWRTQSDVDVTKSSTVVVSIPTGPLWVRATLDLDNGAAGNDVKFYTSTDGSSWTQLGTTVTTAGVTTIKSTGTANLAVGARGASGASDMMTGNVHKAEFRQGIDGAVISAIDFTIQSVGATTFSDPQGHAWTVHGGATLASGASLTEFDWFTIERSLDGGVMWSTFRYGGLAVTDQLPETLSTFIIHDYEAPINVAVQYRAYVASMATGMELDSLYATATVTITTPYCYLKDPQDYTRNMRLRMENDWFDTALARIRSIHRALGRDLPVVVRQEGIGITLVVTILSMTKAEHDALLLLIESNRTLFFQTPRGSWYVELSADVADSLRVWDLLQNETEASHTTLSLVEVDF